MASSRACTPVVSAAVSSGGLPLPQDRGPRGWGAPRLRVALERAHEPESDRLDDGVDQVRHAPPFQCHDIRLQALEPAPEPVHLRPLITSLRCCAKTAAGNLVPPKRRSNTSSRPSKGHTLE